MPRKYGTVLIAGPTASGKSRLALELAEAVGGIVVNADSMQVYRELRVLTARPTPQDEARAPHRLYGFRPAAQPYSVGLWLADIRSVLDEARAEGRMAVIVGGTGLYFSALTEGLSDIPPIPAEVREKWRGESAAQDAPELHAMLAARDPHTAAQLRPSDTQRIVRALEVLDATGIRLRVWQERKSPPLLGGDSTVKVVLLPEREEIYARCDARFEAMLEAGALEEAAALAELALPADVPAMRAVGVAPLQAYLRGEVSFDAARIAAKTETRRYAKRQLTWIKSKMMSWRTYSTQDLKRTKNEIMSLMRDRLTVCD
jgi:tRNA dimethylallyltransferase